MSDYHIVGDATMGSAQADIYWPALRQSIENTPVTCVQGAGNIFALSTLHDRPSALYFLFVFLRAACERALPAAALLAAPVRPSRNTWDAAVAAAGLVVLLELPFLGTLITSFPVDLVSSYLLQCTR